MRILLKMQISFLNYNFPRWANCNKLLSVEKNHMYEYK